jgi:S-adenosylmethionine-diacylglycerol 3-amino-3-carboxypropyl transferase
VTDIMFHARLRKLQRAHYEGRVAISLAIVACAGLLSFGVFFDAKPTLTYPASAFGIGSDAAVRFGFLILVLPIALVSLLRMWAGSALTSERVMSSNVRLDSLVDSGPYALVRNPIYLADLVAMCVFALCLPPVGLALPVLFYLHYRLLIQYEERAMSERFGRSFTMYCARVRRLVPRAAGLMSFLRTAPFLPISRDGFRHNSLFLLFIPGLAIAAYTREFRYAVLVAIPALGDWAIVHMRIGSRSSKVTHTQLSPTAPSKVFRDVLYAQCWEDPSLDRRALDINSDDDVFSITSGGCNLLAFLLDNPRKVIALDANTHQNFLLELKIAAFRSLEYKELLEFVGVTESSRRAGLYARLQDVLSRQARYFWDHRQVQIQSGIIHCGRYEGYIALLRRWIERLMGRKLIEQFFKQPDPQARTELFARRWNNLRWRLFTRILLSRRLMTLLFDPAFFEHVKGTPSFGDHFAKRFEHALTRMPLPSNYFLSFILQGRFSSDRDLPPYLARENFAPIRDRLDRVQIVTDTCAGYFSGLPSDCLSKFNFSNIFEWMAPLEFEALLRSMHRVARDGAILTFRNLLVERRIPPSLSDRFAVQDDLAAALLEEDRSFIYSNYVVAVVRKRDAP